MRLRNNEIFNEVFSLTIPITIQMLISIGMSTIDSFTVGHLGDLVIGGVGAANKFLTVANSLSQSFIGVAGIYIGQFYGAKNNNKMSNVFKSSLQFGIFISCLLVIFSAAFPKQIISFYNTEQEIINSGSLYIRISSFSYILMAISTCISMYLRNTKYHKSIVRVSLISIVCKLLLNYSFIFLFETGVVGVGICNILTRLVELSLYISVLKINKIEPLAYSDKCSDKILVKEIMKKAIPLMINDFLYSASFSITLKFLGMRDTCGYNGYIISSSFVEILRCFLSGYGGSCAIYISQKLGNNDIEGANKSISSLVIYGMLFSIFITILGFTFVLGIPVFYKNSAIETIAAARQITIIQSLLIPLWMYNFITYNILRSGGDMKSVMIMDSGMNWLVQIPVMYMLLSVTDFGTNMIFTVGQLGEVAKMAVSTILVKKGRWMVNMAGDKND